ncbi:MAG: TRAM domain-containing protein [Bacilli bacterium]|nr:MAG: TRAM domain-containing protein [Bacilli bacterium]
MLLLINMLEKIMKNIKIKIVPVLIEGYSDKGGKLMGYTDTMKLVNVVGDPSNIGSIVPVRITEVKTWSMEGEVVSDRK